MNEPYSAYPLSWPLGWPRRKSRVESRFGKWNRKPSVAEGSRHVLEELRRMGVPNYDVIISTNVQLRGDGLPYSNQREPDDTGAAVYFKLKGKQKVLACDKYSTVGENLYAIGHTIEATRGIERWGSVTTEQAFAGYVALQEKTEPSCWDTLGINEESIREVRPSHLAHGMIMKAWRDAVKTAHPDTGGNADDFDRINRAKDTALQLVGT